MHTDLTIVTALFDLGREKLEPGFSRSFDHYIECFKKFLKATSKIPLVVFTEAKNEKIVWEHRSRDNTKVMVKDKNWLKQFPFYTEVQQIRNDPKWKGQAGWLPGSPQSALELYNPLVMSKHFMLNDASLFNFFNTNHFLWMDAGLSNTVNLDSYIDETFPEKVIPKLEKMLYLCFPYDGQVEVHGFSKKAMNSYAGQDTKWVARGGVFGGNKEYINNINSIYYNLLHDTLKNGYMGTEESIFTLITYQYPHLCDLHMIEGNGLVYKFFEDIKHAKVKRTNKRLSIYVLTYNLPEQFKMWVESFERNYPRDLKNADKYVVNNSTDPDVAEAYDELFKKYGFTEFKKNNIGINSGRQFVAEHFATTDNEYMVFFEDDMLLHDRGNVCKVGFTTHQEDLFSKCMVILRNEKLDYLKLCFSEFYGDNHENWAWYNVPEAKRKEYFSRTDGVSEKKVKISHTASYRNLPYAVGEYHYCNWPILFSQEGNKKVFLDTKWAHEYEQTWMSHVMNLMREGKVKAGCLLASPINHRRDYHYKGKRKENKNY